jgi:hypothetical protein
MSGDDMDLFSAEGCRTALATLTTAFLAGGEKSDINLFKASVSAIGLMLEDYARQSRDELETDMARLRERLDVWEAGGANA